MFGVGRGVWESSMKAVFADFFPNDATAGFANMALQNGFSAGVGFLVFALPAAKTDPDHTHSPVIGNAMAIVTLFFGVLGIITYRAADAMNAREAGYSAIQ